MKPGYEQIENGKTVLMNFDDARPTGPIRTESEVRRYPSVEEIAALLRKHQFKQFLPRSWGMLCKDGCRVQFSSADNPNGLGSTFEAAHQASVIVAMWEELAREGKS